jgi:hypothetical protein
MALRYTKTPEINYVPSYAGIDPQILSQTNAQIQRQVEMGEAGARDAIDVAGSNIANNLANLGEEDQAFVQNQFTATKENISSALKTQGPRNIMPFVDEEVNKLNQSLKHHRKVSAANAQVASVLEESEAPTDVLQEARTSLGKVKYDEETGKAVGSSGGVNVQDLDTIRNWEDFDDYLNKFGPGNAKTIESTFGDNSGYSFQEQLADGTVVNYRSTLKELGFDELQSQKVGALLSDPKMRRQLELYARARINQGQYGENVKATKDGTILYTRKEYRKDTNGNLLNKAGQKVTDVEKADIVSTTEEVSPSAWVAAEIAKPWSAKDVVLEQQYKTLKGQTASSNSEEPIEELIDVGFLRSDISLINPDISTDQYFEASNKLIQEFEREAVNARSSAKDATRNFFFDADDPKAEMTQITTVDGETSIVVPTDKDGEARKYTSTEFSSLVNERVQEALTAGNIAKAKVVQRNGDEVLARLATIDLYNAKAQSKQEQLDSINRGIREKLRSEGVSEGAIKAIEFNSSGTLTLKEGLPESGKFEELERVLGFEINQEDFKHLKEGEIAQATLPFYYSTDAPLGMALTQKTDTPTYITKKGGKVIAVKFNNEILNKALKAQKEIVKQVTDPLEAKKYLGVTMFSGNKLHEEIRNTYLDDPSFNLSSGINVTDPTGKQIKEEKDWGINQRFRLSEVAIMDGKPVMVGMVTDKEGNMTEDSKRVYIHGKPAESAVKRLYGDVAYDRALKIDSFKSLMPELVNNKAQVSLTPAMQRNLFSSTLGESINISYNTSEDQYGEFKEFKTTIGGQQVTAKTIVDLYLLINEIMD